MSHSKLLLGSVVLTWAALIGVGMSYLAYYDYQPGDTLAAPARVAALPAGVPQKQRLLMFVHPKCPCSTASLRELERLMARCTGYLEATIYFIRPEDEPDTWVHGNLWTLAGQIPGATRAIDAGGEHARQFGATTSGSIVVYSPAGNLEYQGGITTSRGHEGDSPGKDAIFAIARGEPQANVQCPVYGCPLQSDTPSPQ